MKISVQKIPGSRVQITVTDSVKAYEKAREEVIATLAKTTQVKGFRKGAGVPEAIVVKEHGEGAISERAINLYLDRAYPKILAEAKIAPVSPGEVKDIESLSLMEIVLEIEVVPEVAIDEKKLGKIKLEKEKVQVEKSEVDEAIAEIEKRFTHFHDAGWASEDGFDAGNVKIELGDRVTIDTQGFDKQWGKEIPETKVHAFPLVIGSGQFIPGFEEKLVGHHAGEVVEFDIVFPKDYHADDFKNRKVYFMTTIFKLEKPHKPVWDEAFIEKLRGVKTDLSGFREILKREILGEKERRAREVAEAKLLDELEKIAAYEIGETMLEREIESVFREQKSNLENQGYSMKTYLEHLKKDEESYKKEVIAKEAHRRVSAELLLRQIREIKKIEATDQELAEEIDIIIAQYTNPDVIARLKEKLVPGDAYYEDIRIRLSYRKVVDSFFTTK